MGGKLASRICFDSNSHPPIWSTPRLIYVIRHKIDTLDTIHVMCVMTLPVVESPAISDEFEYWRRRTDQLEIGPPPPPRRCAVAAAVRK